MKYPLAILLFSVFFAVSSYGGDAIPKKSDFNRFQVLLDRSPFAVATAPIGNTAPTPNAFKDLYIANAAKSPEGDMVTVGSSTDKNLKEYLTTKEPNPHGYSIASIEWSDKVGQTKVTISKDGQFGVLTFNQALISTPGGPATGPQMPTVPQPGMQPTPVVVPASRPAVPSLPTPPPRVRGVIPRNPNVPAQQPAQTPVMVPTPSDD